MDETKVAVEVAKIIQRLDNNDLRIKALEETIKRIESLTIAVEKLALSVEQMAKEQVTYGAKQDALTKRIIDVEQAPAKEKAGKADKITSQIVTLLIGALVGFLLKTFLGI